jgi:hypothetical protein
MKINILKVLMMSAFCCGVLVSCSDSNKEQGFGPVPHEKDIENLIEKAESIE